MPETPDLLQDMAALLKRHPAATSEDLKEVLKDLSPQGDGYVITRTASEHYTWAFEHPDSLRAQLQDVFKTQAVCLKLPTPVALLDDVNLRVTLGDHVEDFTGRVVHVTPEHAAIQVRPHHAQARQRLLDACDAWTPTPAGAPLALTPAGAPLAPSREAAPVTTLNRWTHRPLILDVLLVAGRHEGPHQLRVTSDQGLSTFWFDGEDVLAMQTPDDPTPMDTVIGALELDEESLEFARRDAAQLGLSLALCLADRGVVNHDTIRGALRARHMALLTQALDEERALSIEHVEMPHVGRRREAAPLNIYAAVFEYLREHTDPDTLHDDSFKHARFQYVGQEELLGRMALEDRELRLMEAIAPKRTTFFDLHRFTSLAKQDVHSLLHVMERLGLVERAEHSDDAIEAHHQQEAMDSFEHMARRIQHGSHFEALGVHWSSHAKEIHAGYRQQLQRLDAHRRAPNHDALRVKLQRAYRALCDPEGRAAYRRTILDDYTIHAATHVLFTRIEGAQLKFDDQTVKACAKTILELHPSDQDIRARLRALVADAPSWER